MSNPYNETTVRTRIETVLNAITDKGLVYTREVLFSEWKKLKEKIVTKIDDEDQIRAWMISCDQVEDVGPDDPDYAAGFAEPGEGHMRYHYKIFFVMGVDDSKETELTHTAMALEAKYALDKDPNLHSGKMDAGADGYFCSDPSQITALEPRVYGGILCHYAEFRMMVEEVV